MDIMFEFLVQEGEIVEAKSPSKLFISVEQIPKINCALANTICNRHASSTSGEKQLSLLVELRMHERTDR